MSKSRQVYIDHGVETLYEEEKKRCDEETLNSGLSSFQSKKFSPSQLFDVGHSWRRNSVCAVPHLLRVCYTGVSHYSEPLFEVFGFVPNNQNSENRPSDSWLRDEFVSFPRSSVFLRVDFSLITRKFSKIYGIRRENIKKQGLQLAMPCGAFYGVRRILV